MVEEIDRTPSRKTLRKYFPNSILTDDELYSCAKQFALLTKTQYVRPKSNKYFPAFLKLTEIHKEKLLKFIDNVSKHDEEQCWEEHDCLNEIIKSIDKMIRK